MSVCKQTPLYSFTLNRYIKGAFSVIYKVQEHELMESFSYKGGCDIPYSTKYSRDKTFMIFANFQQIAKCFSMIFIVNHMAQNLCNN